MFWALAKELPEMHVPTSNMQYCQCALFVNQLFHAKSLYWCNRLVYLAHRQTAIHTYNQLI